MFIIRPVEISDLESLYSLSLLENFLNLPQDKELLLKKIERSIRSFKSLGKFEPENSFLFVLVDQENKKIAGCSNLHAQHGTLDKPHYFLSVKNELKSSLKQKLNFTHKTLKLGMTENGYTEIGGLILDPAYRGHAQKLGKQISFSRFLFISMHPHLFTKQIHTELLPPFDKNGNSPLWEGLGKQFFEMNYLEADILSRRDKSFILEIFPAETIYVKLLSPSAQKAIGEVGETTKPVKNMLEKIGFKYQDEVDPFDGGPHYRAIRNEILPINESMSIKLKGHLSIKNPKSFLIASLDSDFQASFIQGEIKSDGLYIDSAYKETLNSLASTSIKCIPL